MAWLTIVYEREVLYIEAAHSPVDQSTPPWCCRITGPHRD